VATARQVAADQLVEAVDEQDQAFSPGFAELDVGKLEQVVDGFQQARALLFDRGAEIGPGVRPVLQLHGQRCIRNSDVPAERDFSTEGGAELVPQITHSGGGDGKARNVGLAELLLGFPCQKDQEIRKVQVVQVQRPADVGKDHVKRAPFLGTGMFEHALQAKELTALPHASMPCKYLHLRLERIGEA